VRMCNESCPRVHVEGGGRAVVSQAGGVLLVETARRTGLDQADIGGSGAMVHGAGGARSGVRSADGQVIVDIDGVLVPAHCEKQDVAATWGIRCCTIPG